MNIQNKRLHGLIAATFTPLDDRGAIQLSTIAPMVDFLINSGIQGLYVLGSTGEGVSMTVDERRKVAAAFVEAAAGRIPVIVQVGCESLQQARDLAEHAQSVGADAISAVSPLYFKPASVQSLVDSMAVVADGAPELPFYYYHIPPVTGVNFDMIEFLTIGGDCIDNLRGIKFSTPMIHEFQSCLEYGGDRFEILWGVDEMLMSGLMAGASAAVGSTYNFAASLYQRIISALETGDLDAARVEQSRSQRLVRTFLPFGSRAAQKAIMNMVGPNCGPARLPVTALHESEIQALRSELEAIGFFEW
jgi:N-acetylneuraminate lyase